MSEVEQNQRRAEISLPIDWHIPDGFQSRYANNVLVQAGQFEVIISFFETQLPMLLGTPEENKEKLTELGSVRAECVSRIIVSPELVPSIINALQAEYEKYQALKSGQ